jgi:formylglycine-generating enzyme required for sulfatase activity
MGETAFYPEERPTREAPVPGFWIDRHPVTNQQYARFVAATRYVTQAERPDAQGSMVFREPAQPAAQRPDDTAWHWMPGADWRHPRGPETSTLSLAQHPVVQITLADALAYCAWAGGELPTEAEWEYAARGGRQGAIFTWGNEERPNGRFMANTWQGHFPYHNTAEDGFRWTSPVGSFPANGYGLLDMAGNVWEWTADSYRVTATEAGAQATPTSQHVVKGGSHLCAPGSCFRYRPAARQPQPTSRGACDLGFRIVMRPHP